MENGKISLQYFSKSDQRSLRANFNVGKKSTGIGKLKLKDTLGLADKKLIKKTLKKNGKINQNKIYEKWLVCLGKAYFCSKF